ncbi:4-(cytidine 5'-diphospho)-2-C-methyl-D-erythritol kinase [Hydrogenophaga defluvii]|uniref:4-diphosphocytidyl-2-C-methyl-D-erythritol kinase n=1 Tax=Hydrogenophaga defluvii TaxID=249410 RepID=A0ABW2SHX4_9BURK
MNTAVIETPTELRNVPAPAKLNVFLHIVGRRPDGYHLLQSVFMLIDWCDTLHFKLRADGAIHRIDALPGATLPEHDLVVRAAQALQTATGCTLGADITLEKRLPSEAGMGSGSSDAASTLLALNRLWDLRLSRPQLAHIGLTLGADVPFFVGGRNAWVEGIGEQLTPVALPPGRFVVVKPPTGASTAAIFGSSVLKRDTKPAILSGFAADAQQNPDRIWNYGANDLQAVAQAVCPEISDCIAWLSRKGLQARMTGSGSAVFAPWVESTDLSDAPPGWQVKICSNWAEHPLRAWCEG